MNGIKVTKINKKANKWSLEYASNGIIKEFSWFVSSELYPIEFNCNRKYILNVLKSDLKNTEKTILIYMANSTFFGTTLCLYTAHYISKDVNISYKTVRTAISHLIELGLLSSGKIISNKGNVVRQYVINPDTMIDNEHINEVHYSDEVYKEYDPMCMLSDSDLR